MKLIAAILLSSMMAGAALSDVFYLHADMPAGSTPNDKTLWFDDPVAGTSQYVIDAPNTGNRFDMNGYDFRTATGTSHTFSGTLVAGESTMAMMYAYTWNLTGLEVAGGTLLLRPHQTSIAMNVSSLTMGASGIMDIRTLTGNNIVNLSVADLSGSGHIRFGIDSYANDVNGVWSLSVTDTTPEFTGTVDLTRGQLTFGNSFSLADAAFVVNAAETNSVVMANNVTFSSVTFGSTTLTTGTYTADELNTVFGTDRFSGTGTMTIPEPTTLSMLGLGMLIAMVIRFSRAN